MPKRAGFFLIVGLLAICAQPIGGAQDTADPEPRNRCLLFITSRDRVRQIESTVACFGRRIKEHYVTVYEFDRRVRLQLVMDDYGSIQEARAAFNESASEWVQKPQRDPFADPAAPAEFVRVELGPKPQGKSRKRVRDDAYGVRWLCGQWVVTLSGPTRRDVLAFETACVALTASN